MQDALLTPTGLNSTFNCEGMSYEDYISHMRDIIVTTRPDLKQGLNEDILNANLPFELKPNDSDAPPAILWHGLYGSPYRARPFANILHEAGYRVRAMTLPGHGTVPGDLLHCHYKSWEQAADFGVKSFLDENKDTFTLGGMSMGACLALQQAMKHPEKTKQLVLVSPALRPRHLSTYRALIYPLLSFVSKHFKWYLERPLVTYAQYTCHSVHAVVEALQLMHRMHHKLKKTTLSMPIFVSMTTEDEVVDWECVVEWFRKQPNPRNRFILYSAQSLSFDDDRIIVRNSVYPQEEIIGFSHPCVQIPPDDKHYGRDGEFQDFLHYPDAKCPHNDKPIKLGEYNLHNARRYRLQRLTYNPDFAFLREMLLDFLNQVD